ncbi:MAG: hypothetical protein KatS3mg005_1648 [Bryobacteraceae bacterium]|nr:MAG: hypothetical protein KatS3mg005_1648 [Bryobacteraceae bacterium]
MLACLAAAGQRPCSQASVYMPCELEFELSAEEATRHVRPYETVSLRAEFRSPEFKTYLVHAFWRGGRRLTIRFTPTEAGQWTYRLTSNLPAYDGQQGNFNAAPAPPPAAFIRRANVHHWQYTEERKPHLYMGAEDQPGTAVSDWKARRFTHLAVRVLPESAFAGPDQPDAEWFEKLDARVYEIHSAGITVDFLLARTPKDLATIAPSPAQRERLVRYLTGRYAAFNCTWQLVEEWEAQAGARDILKDFGTAIKKMDPYGHPISTRARDSAAFLGRDGWMDHVIYGPDRDELIAVEHQSNTVPQVALIDGSLPPDEFRRRLWRAVMSGAYPSMKGGSGPDSPNARTMEAWSRFMSERVRFWDTQPYFDVEGGRAIALPGLKTEDYELPATEYIVYIEKPGPVKVTTRKHTYDVYWVNPATGEGRKEKRSWKGELYETSPPGPAQDWVLHLSRDGRKEGMLRSYKFESWPVPVQEPERSPQKAPFELAKPAAGETLTAGAAVPFEITLKRQTGGTRRMTYVLTGEVVQDGEGARYLAAGQSGAFTVDPLLMKSPTGALAVRLAALNAAGKLYLLDYVFPVKKDAK